MPSLLDQKDLAVRIPCLIHLCAKNCKQEFEEFTKLREISQLRRYMLKRKCPCGAGEWARPAKHQRSGPRLDGNCFSLSLSLSLFLSLSLSISLYVVPRRKPKKAPMTVSKSWSARISRASPFCHRDCSPYIYTYIYIYIYIYILYI